MDLSSVHLHLMLNHIPVLGFFFLVLLLSIGLLRKSSEILRAGLVLTVLFSLAAGGVFLTGEPAEHQAEDHTWFNEDRAHEHEERAETGLIAAVATGLLAIVALWFARKGGPVKPGMATMVLVAVVVCAGLFAWTALAGGEIRHDEIRAGAQTLNGEWEDARVSPR